MFLSNKPNKSLEFVKLKISTEYIKAYFKLLNISDLDYDYNLAKDHVNTIFQILRPKRFWVRA